MLGDRLRHVRGSAAELLTKAEQGMLIEEVATAVGGRYDLSSNRGEVGAWRNSLPVLLEVLRDAGLSHVEVLLEHRLPYGPKRVDALLCDATQNRANRHTPWSS